MKRGLWEWACGLEESTMASARMLDWDGIRGLLCCRPGLLVCGLMGR